MYTSALTMLLLYYFVLKKMKTKYSGSDGWGCLALGLGVIEFAFITILVENGLNVFTLISVPSTGVALLLSLISYAASEYEGARERVELRKEERARECACYEIPILAALRSKDRYMRGKASAAFHSYGFSKSALEELCQTYALDQLFAAEPIEDNSSINLEKPGPTK